MAAIPIRTPERARSFSLHLADGQTASIETCDPATLSSEAEQWTTASGVAGEWAFRARIGVVGLEAALRMFHPFFTWSDLSPEEALSAIQWLANATAACSERSYWPWSKWRRTAHSTSAGFSATSCGFSSSGTI